MPSPTAVLSASQLALLAEHGEKRRADVGEVLYRVGDHRYPLIAILEGEAAILDARGTRSSVTALPASSARRTSSQARPCI